MRYFVFKEALEGMESGTDPILFNEETIEQNSDLDDGDLLVEIFLGDTFRAEKGTKYIPYVTRPNKKRVKS